MALPKHGLFSCVKDLRQFPNPFMDWKMSWILYKTASPLP